MNIGLKMKFEKEKEKKRKENQRRLPFSLDGQAAHQASRAGPLLSSSPFFFSRGADDRSPPVILSPSLSFLLPPAAHPGRRRRAIPTAPGRLPTFLSSPRGQLRQSNTL
jgi:hypothetical protein